MSTCRTWIWRNQYQVIQSNKSTNFKFGERGSGLRARGDVQDFYKLRDQCLEDGVLFEDPEFPPIDASLFMNSNRTGKRLQWKRPTELVKQPRFFVEGASRFDIVQGDLGDCWLLAAVANLTLHPQIFHRVVPTDQSFVEKYAGIFHFRFWQYGKWVDVVVDDRLPTVYGELAYLHSDQRNEFWSALLEKAYAKLHGCYEALKGGSSLEAMEDFTGGVTEYYELDKAPKNLQTILLKGYERSSLMSCGLKSDPLVAQKELPNGLVRGHAYSITAVKLVTLKSPGMTRDMLSMVDIRTPRKTGKIPLLRIRNPWGKAEWKGAWSDGSREWQLIPEEQKRAIGLVFETDGEFWMSFADFMKNFDNLELCNLDPDSLEEELLSENPTKTWQTRLFEGCWVRGITAGGCAKFRDTTFASNPQYCITLEDPDEGEEEDEHDDCTCTVIVALMQKNRRAQRRMGLDTLPIGFMVYRVEDPKNTPRPLDKNFFRSNLSVARTNNFINLREVSGRFKLPPGTYCIVPSTYDANQEGDFILRVFCEKKTEISEFDDSLGEGEVDKRVDREDDKDKQTELRERFKSIAGDDLEVDAYELKDILDFVLTKEFKFKGFGLNLCRSMVAMMDDDRSGKLGLEEFKDLWFSIVTWKNVFKLYDKNGTGSINTFDLRRALESAGYRLNWHVMNILGLRHSNKEGVISFEDFIVCAVKLKHIIELFRGKDVHRQNKATFTLEEWIESAMYA